jgi:hypothetical protein
MRLALPLAILALAAGLLAGCGGSSDGGSSSGTGAGAGTGTREGAPPAQGSPEAPAGASAQACAVGGAGSLRATGVSCAEAKSVLLAWQAAGECAGAPGASHSSCSVGGYRCIGARTGRGLAVSCAQPGRSIAFVAKG